MQPSSIFSNTSSAGWGEGGEERRKGDEKMKNGKRESKEMRTRMGMKEQTNSN